MAKKKATKAKGTSKVPVSKSKKSDEPTEITIRYDLLELPTAFHKAGLAGLILQIESLIARRKLTRSEIDYNVETTRLTITFTSHAIGLLFDDLYDATPQPPKPPKQTKQAGGKPAKATATADRKDPPPSPKLTALRDLLPNNDELWVKLYRDMLFQTIRSQPATWLPYKDRILGHPYRKAQRDPWIDLVKWDGLRREGIVGTDSLSGSLLPGIQESSPDGLTCRGAIEQNIVLHFWPLAVLVYCPRAIKVERDNGELKVSTTFPGFALVVPDIGDLPKFLVDLKTLLHQLDSSAAGYRPAGALVDIPSEGALALLNHLAQLNQQVVEDSELRLSIRSAEFVYLVKDKRNVKAMTSGRVSPNPYLLAQYRSLVNPIDPAKRYFNPLFRRALIKALLEGIEWSRPFGELFATCDTELFFRPARSRENGGLSGTPLFANDAQKRLQAEFTKFNQLLEKGKSMPEHERTKVHTPLAVIVDRVVKTYIFVRANEKIGNKMDRFRIDDKIDWSAIPDDIKEDFNNAKQKLAQSLFMELRSRKEQAFVNLFAAAFFSETQRINEADRLELANALTNVDRHDDLKTLTLLSLSANS